MAALTAAILTTVALMAVRAAGAETIKLATLVPKASLWDRAVREMGAEWQRLSGGRVELRIYPGGVAGDDPDMVRKMRIGQLQAATVTVSGLTEIDPAFALFEVPLFFGSFDELLHVLEELEPELDARLAEQGFRRLHWAHAGWIHFFTTEPAASIEAFRRLRIFVWAGNDRMTGLWQRHGFRAVPLAATDILAGLETGLFQALPVTPIAALSLQWFRSAPNMIDLPLAPLIGATLIEERAWRELPAESRDDLLAAARVPGARFVEQIPREERLAIETMRQRGLSVQRVVGGPLEASWRAATEAFALDMRRAFVPEAIYDRAVRLRDAYRQAQRPAPGNP